MLILLCKQNVLLMSLNKAKEFYLIKLKLKKIVFMIY